MRIRSFEVCNFRQFYGIQYAELCGATPTDPHNVNLIYGKNGRGKTGLFRAAMFCLFGDKELAQDRNHEDNDERLDELILINLKALQEDSQSEHHGVNSYVRMSFTHREKSYEMTRSLFGVLDSAGSVVEEDRGVKLSITDRTGNTTLLGPADAKKIAEEIRGILDPRVKDYFLFDGERIERLTKATSTQKKHVSEGIRRLLRIDELLDVESAVGILDGTLTKELQKVSTGELQKKLLEKQLTMDEEATADKEIARLENELQSANDQVAQLDKELQQYEQVKGLLDDREKLENQIKKVREGSKIALRNKMRKFTSAASALLAKDLIDQVYVDIDAKVKKGEIPSHIKKELIAKLLTDGICICGTCVKPESTEYHQLKVWESKTSNQDQQAILGLFGDLGQASAYSDSKADELADLLEEGGRIEEDLDRLDLELEGINKQLEGKGNVDLKSKNQARTSVLMKIGSMDAELKKCEARKADAQGALARIEKDVIALQQKSNEHKALVAQHELVMKSKAVVRRIKEEFMKQVRNELETKATANFKQLLDAEGQKTLKRIKVNDDYSLEVLDWRDRPFLANVSAGQRQIVSLSFIMALAQVAGGSTVLEVPLFMDTPFGRLSGEHRENLLRLIPKVCPQWILLATETEFGVNEYQQLRDSHQWGSLYVLRTVREGTTDIVKEPIDFLGNVSAGVN